MVHGPVSGCSDFIADPDLLRHQSHGHASVYTPVIELEFFDPVLKECVVQQAKQNGWGESGLVTALGFTNPETTGIQNLSGIENLVDTWSGWIWHTTGLLTRCPSITWIN